MFGVEPAVIDGLVRSTVSGEHAAGGFVIIRVGEAIIEIKAVEVTVPQPSEPTIVLVTT
jgi:hypothetical protein